MKNFHFFLFLLLLISCKPSVESVWNSHFQPDEKQDNKLEIGTTIVFRYTQQEGINRSEYPEPSYPKIVDTSYFKKLKTEEINDGTDGGITTYFEIFEAIKKGKTKIETFEVLTKKIKANDSVYYQQTNRKLKTFSFTIQ